MIAASDHNKKANKTIISDPPFAQALFGDVRWAWIWLIVRLYVGYEWLLSGWGKINNPAWVGSKAGTALTGFVNNSLTQTTGAHPAVQGWYAAFLRAVILPATGIWCFWRDSGWRRFNLRCVHRNRCFLWILYEYELPISWISQYQSRLVIPFHLYHISLENCRVVGARSMGIN